MENNIKKFEGFLDRMRGLLDSARKQGHIIVRVEDLENAFPEIKEYEDEKIRKVIRGWIYTQPDSFFDNGISKEEMLTWLEKQGEQKSTDNLTPQEAMDIAVAKCFDEQKPANSYCQKSCKGFQETGKCFADSDCKAKREAESIGKVKPKFHEGGKKAQPSHSCHDITALGRCYMEAINTSSNKIEPKFEIEKGKWYVCNTSRYTDFIVGKAYYCPKNGMLKPNENEMARYVARDCFHPWTINDAKDGDVLVIEETETTYKTIFIFKEIEDTHIIHYVYYLNTGIEQVFEKRSANGFVGFIDEVVHPATKEQCDTQMIAMKDAGYEFDFMKKELKEILEPKFNVGDTIVPKHNPTTNKIYFTITDITGGKYWYNDRIICDIAEQDEWEVLEQKPAWSAEDEHRFKDTIYFLDTAKKHYASTVELDACIDWLKSLKQRINKE